MNAVQQFMKIVQKTPENEQSPAVENTFLRFCTDCFELMPHYRRDDHCECSVCGLKTYRKVLSESGMACLEVMFWLALIAIGLLVLLKDKPW